MTGHSKRRVENDFRLYRGQRGCGRGETRLDDGLMIMGRRELER